MKKKKLAFYIGSLQKGGAERVMVNLAEYFFNQGYDVTLVTTYLASNEYEVENAAWEVEKIVSKEKAYVLGLLHDIGRRFGNRHLGHVYDGYSYMMSLGYDDVAQICLTHSFTGTSIYSYAGKVDTDDEETDLIVNKLKEATIDDYDRLIRLCDALAGNVCVMDIIDRMNDVRKRYGRYDQEKWDDNLALKDYFEKKMGMDLYEAVDKDSFCLDLIA